MAPENPQGSAKRGASATVRSPVASQERSLADASNDLACAKDKLLQEIAERKRAENALRASEARMRLITDAMPAMLAYVDAKQRYCYHNKAFETWLGLTADQIDGRHLREVLGKETYNSIKEQIKEVLSGKEVHFEHAQRVKGGAILHLSVYCIPHFVPDGKVHGFYGMLTDITERKGIESALFDEKERAQVTLESIGDAVITTDDEGKILYQNPVAERLTGWSNNETRGLPLHAIFRITSEATGEAVENPVQRCLAEGRPARLPEAIKLTRRDGKEFAIDDSAAPIRDRQGNIIGAVLVFHDVTQQRIMARQLSHEATHDALTGLVNRPEFERRVMRILSSSRTDRSHHALCYLDLDQFKVVNDTCGHIAGDALLRQIGGALQQRLRQRDTLARLGGDEFGVLLEHCPLSQAMRIANDLRETVDGFRFIWEGKPFSLSVSIGVVVITDEGDTLSDLLRKADAACYISKEGGRNRVHLYQPDDAEAAKRGGEMQWVGYLEDALARGRFKLFTQSIIPLNPGRGEPAYQEIFIRLEYEEDSLVAPGTFIPPAERHNLMPAVDRWVVSRVIGWCAGKSPAQSSPPVCCVNLSGATLRDAGFADFVRQELDIHHVPAGLLCFEITESAAIANLNHATPFICSLKALGCLFSLDDFGAGISSFAYLKNLPVDFLKIDGNLVRGIEDDPVALAMTEAINRVGHVMGLKTIAEFVENQVIMEKLRKLKVDYAQGFGISGLTPLTMAE